MQALVKIVEWGKRGFRESVLGLLEQIEGPVLGGLLGRLDEGSVMGQEDMCDGRWDDGML